MGLGSSWSYCCCCCPVEHSQVLFFFLLLAVSWALPFFPKAHLCLFYKTSFCFPPAPIPLLQRLAFPEAASQQALPCMWPLVCLAALSWQVHLFQDPLASADASFAEAALSSAAFSFSEGPNTFFAAAAAPFSGAALASAVFSFSESAFALLFKHTSFAEAGLASAAPFSGASTGLASAAPFSGASTFFGASAFFQGLPHSLLLLPLLQRPLPA